MDETTVEGDELADLDDGRFHRSEERTTAGRCLVVLRSVKGNGTRTMSPRLQGVVGGILRIVPELEGRLSQTEPGQLFRGRSEHGRKPVQHFLLGLRGKIPKGSEDLFNRPARDSHGSRIVSDGRAAVKALSPVPRPAPPEITGPSGAGTHRGS